MRRVLLALALLAGSTTVVEASAQSTATDTSVADSARWMAVYEDADVRMEADTASVVVLGERLFGVRVRGMMRQTPADAEYDAGIVNVEVDCEVPRFRVLRAEMLLRGETVEAVDVPVEAREWHEAPVSAPQRTAMDRGCEAIAARVP